MDASEIADRIELAQLVHRYADAVDNAKTEQFIDVFHPDGRLVMIPAGAAEPASIRDGQEELATTPADLAAQYTQAVHQVSNHLVDVDGDVASGTLLCTARLVTVEGDRVTELVHIAGYQDRYERREGVWRIREREVRIMWSTINDVITDARAITFGKRS
jgi:3-phenylpropionate/cinnamic acid dioxygenase small subunit